MYDRQRALYEKHAGTVVGVACDVRQYDDVRRMICHYVDRFGGLHMLVNNAGVGEFAPMGELAPDDWHNHTPTEHLAWTFQPEDVAELVILLVRFPLRTLPSRMEIRPSNPPREYYAQWMVEGSGKIPQRGLGMPLWVWPVPVGAIALLLVAVGKGGGSLSSVLSRVLNGVALIGAVLVAVHHAEVLGATTAVMQSRLRAAQRQLGGVCTALAYSIVTRVVTRSTREVRVAIYSRRVI